MRFVTALLCLLIGLVWFDLAFGKGNLFEVHALQQKLDAQQAANQQAIARNEQVLAELADLKDGLELVEEKARAELGLAKRDEILVVYGRRR
jgi:cell division protein FtsB